MLTSALSYIWNIIWEALDIIALPAGFLTILYVFWHGAEAILRSL